jgi:hypothetical protein
MKSSPPVVIAIAASLLAGRDTMPKPVPDGYTGPVATLNDSRVILI